MNVYQRIAAVMKDVSYLAKDDTVSTGKSSYKAITEEKVTSTVRAALIAHGLVILPIKQTRTRTDEVVKAWDKYEKVEVEKINRIVSVDVDYRIQNIDEPDDFIIVSSSGEGVDTQDKGVGKAMTYSYKYMLLRSFGIPTGEDPDKISSDAYSEKLYGTREADKAEKFQPNVDNERGELLRDIKACGFSEAAINKACTNKYGKNIGQLNVEELSEVLLLLAERKANEAAS